MYGSPVSGAFKANNLKGGNYWEYWVFWIVVAGPIGLLPYALLERFLPRIGAICMIAAAIFIAEAGIRSGRNYWGYAGVDALIVIGTIAVPFLLMGYILLFARSRCVQWKAVVIAFLVAIVLAIGVGVRYTHEKDYWNENCPESLTQL
jgi:intracellular septation protein A